MAEAISEQSVAGPLPSKKDISLSGIIPAGTRSKFADRAPVFLENCRQNVLVMQHALDEADFQTVAVLAHGMRGAGGMFGFPAITEIGAALQETAEGSDAPGSRKWVGELSSYLDLARSVEN